MDKFLKDIPLEIKYKILKFLPFHTLMSLRLSNKMYWEINRCGRWNSQIDWLLYKKPDSMQIKGKIYVYSLTGPMSDFCFPQHFDGFFGILTIGEYITKSCSYTVLLESPMLKTEFKFKHRTIYLNQGIAKIEPYSIPYKFIGNSFIKLNCTTFYKIHEKLQYSKKKCEKCDFYSDKSYKVHRFTIFSNQLIEVTDDIKLINKNQRSDNILIWSVIKADHPIGIAVLCNTI
ncbi:hypothetical protein LDVICp067 [lymphocystis disease virus-China]|uniref:F-box domain-containing protein n=2 Tax=Lymphocystis disease virus 2 TaxID=159183 RepID=A0A6F8WZY3_9VIRU|nr:hypothetical protein LDVICp067 [lymphocystis disease virus-China]AAU10913.1 hypothetical protein [lymphocystis disease virus-China]BCB67452.1 hypothetical protein [Lymphocystis disease virus 2]